jgi:hypothetical protein
VCVAQFKHHILMTLVGQTCVFDNIEVSRARSREASQKGLEYNLRVARQGPLLKVCHFLASRNKLWPRADESEKNEPRCAARSR